MIDSCFLRWIVLFILAQNLLRLPVAVRNQRSFY
jgi:hypothetical protein